MVDTSGTSAAKLVQVSPARSPRKYHTDLQICQSTVVDKDLLLLLSTLPSKEPLTLSN